MPPRRSRASQTTHPHHSHHFNIIRIMVDNATPSKQGLPDNAPPSFASFQHHSHHGSQCHPVEAGPPRQRTPIIRIISTSFASWFTMPPRRRRDSQTTHPHHSHHFNIIRIMVHKATPSKQGLPDNAPPSFASFQHHSHHGSQSHPVEAGPPRQRTPIIRIISTSFASWFTMPPRRSRASQTTHPHHSHHFNIIRIMVHNATPSKQGLSDNAPPSFASFQHHSHHGSQCHPVEAGPPRQRTPIIRIISTSFASWFTKPPRRSRDSQTTHPHHSHHFNIIRIMVDNATPSKQGLPDNAPPSFASFQHHSHHGSQSHPVEAGPPRQRTPIIRIIQKSFASWFKKRIMVQNHLASFAA